MKILIVSTHDNRGGAAKAAYRFSKEFLQQGNEVCMYVRVKTLEDSFIVESHKSRLIWKIHHILDFLPGYVFSGFNKEVPFTLGLYGEKLNSIIQEFNPDIINIHWTWKGFISFPQICRISKRVPVVWTMHDYSPFSGGLFFHNRDIFLIKWLDKANSMLRRFFLSKANIVFVSPSKYLLKEFNKSYVSSRFKGLVINNGVDTKVFYKRDKEKSKKKFRLDINKRYILFGGINLVNDPIKGGKILFEILKDMEGYLIKNNIGLISFGSQNPFEKLKLDNRIETKFLGFVKTDKEMAEVLSLGDVVLVPSLYENYPFVVLEPVACGVPVVAFDTGGIPEIIKNGRNGYVVKVGSIKDFTKNVESCLSNNLIDSKLEVSSINKAAYKYISLFNNCCKAGIN